MRLLVLVLCLLATAAWSAPPKPAPARPKPLPASVRLDGARDTRQIVLTGARGGQPVDLTRAARWRSANPKVARVVAGRVSPVGDGATVLVATVGGASVRIPVTVAHAARRDPVDFHHELVPILTKQGCATGACHGSPQGKGGFSLSLFGYDPEIDRVSLTRDAGHRRINEIEPDESLLLKKPRLKVPHVGGRRLAAADAALPLMRAWIAEGARAPRTAPACVRLEIAPTEGRVLAAPGATQQMAVRAVFADGSVRDVTRIAAYESSHPGVATVDADGLVTGKTRGQAAVSVRYLQFLESLPVTVLAPVPGFAWKPVPEHNEIDRWVNARLKQLKITAAPTCSDPVFLRRVFLDLTGLLPDPDTARRFLADKTPGKRERLVDTLLASDAFARFWALKKADLMRVTPQRLPDGRAEALARWLAQGWRDNTPWNQVARELLTASGDTRTRPAANYFLAVATPDERTEMTSQIFLGSRIQCAKCHNHPYENWTMIDYYRIGASFARVDADGYRVRDTASGETRHPTRGTVMAPWGTPPGKEPVNRRAAFADWLTAPDNPLFARNEANRIWSELTGRGIVEPVDDFRSSNPPSNAPLLDALTARFLRSGTDRKDLIRWICASQTYQRSAQTDRFNADDDALFSHARVRLLTAEQVQDAIGRATGTLDTPAQNAARLAQIDRLLVEHRTRRAPDDAQRIARDRETVAALPWRAGTWRFAGPFPESQAAPPPKDASAWEPIELPDGTERRLANGVGGVFFLTRTVTAREAAEVRVRISPRDRADVWLDDQEVPRADGDTRLLRLTPGAHRLTIRLRVPDPNQAFRFSLPDGAHAGLSAAAAEALAAGRGIEDPAVRARCEEDAPEIAALLRERKRRVDGEDAATQRPYSAPSAFLSAFGQPKRETACACERQSAPTLLQALELLNGSETYQKLREGAARAATMDDGAMLEDMTLRAFGRFPVAAEKESARRFLASGRPRGEAVLDLLWALISTREFLFQH